ncbi:MAG: hypothetical protein MZV49_16170 [Rhodopseudomonas palustris]|nr:hypothetical protein [Rhodopseudomonas palustris]
MIAEPVQPEIGDRRHVNEDFRDQNQRNGQQQQLSGQADPRFQASVARRANRVCCPLQTRAAALRKVAVVNPTVLT